MDVVAKRRVYHFLKADHGIQNIEKRRIKISTLLGVNDPFELLAHNVSNRSIRDALMLTRKTFDKEFGLLCFSKSSYSPVQWAHYGDRHAGVCLGFDVDANLLEDVCYEDKRTDDFTLSADSESEPEWMRKFLYTKYSHWSYEDEVRAFVALDTEDCGLYFKNFDSSISLVEVQVGFNCELSRSRVSEALGDLSSHVEVFKVRPAFNSFKMVRNLDGSLWE
ncbi:DUF2971 domain-containing protein [Pseudomonas helleri]|uniref:DUF2971 domain-containing protein n=1 Tax=Pseudomonas helleri TaxID=1608996 RepID=UPI001297E821|nr:DUF2971 domain-containing protein [Pseudomonas helleri]MQU60987.1 DUF2971 domain-containing protein [Pseudomonas helleri]